MLAWLGRHSGLRFSGKVKSGKVIEGAPDDDDDDDKDNGRTHCEASRVRTGRLQRRS